VRRVGKTHPVPPIQLDGHATPAPKGHPRRPERAAPPRPRRPAAKSAGGTSGCPVASAYADTLNASFQWSAGASSCAPFQAQFYPSYAEGGHTFLGYGANDGVTLRTD
jgi:hypothetical protein